MSDNLNDNHSNVTAARATGPDAHGQAAFLLVESLIHQMVAQSALTLDAAIEVVEIAAEVKVEVAHLLGDSPETLRRSLILLENLAGSLRADLRG